MPKKKKPYGYVVSGSRTKNGRFFKTLSEAKKEMYRQIRAGAKESGISEVWSKEVAEYYLKK